MATFDQVDPSFAGQLYGASVPSLADAMPAPSYDPWSWVPTEWQQPDANVAPAGIPSIPGAPPIVPIDAPPEFAAAPAVVAAPVDMPPPAGPQFGPPSPSALDGTLFDAAPAAPPVSPADAAAAGLPDVPPTPAPDVPAPTGPPVLGPPKPTRVADLADFTPHIETNAEVYETHPWDNPVDAERDAAARHLALTDPIKFEQYKNDIAASKEAQRASEQARIDRANADQARANAQAQENALKAAQARSAQIESDAQTLNTRTDRGRWFRNLSTGQKVAAVIGALAGTIMSRPGGPNLGAESVAKHIDDDINDQKADIENAQQSIASRRGAVAQEFARTGDLYRATEAVRLASYQDALGQLQTMQQNFDPHGTSFARVGQEAQAMQARISAAAESVRKTAFDEGYKVEQLKQTSAVNAETRRHNQALESAERYRLSLEAGKKKEDATEWSPDQLKILNPGQAVPPIPMTLKAYGQWLETQKTGEQHKNAALQNNPDERNRELSVGGIVDDKGQPVRFRSAAMGGDVAQAKEDAEEIVRLADELTGMIRKNGWTTKLFNGDAYRKMASNFNSLIVRKKEQDKLGVLTGPDVGIVTGELGTEDPSEARSPLGGLEQFRHNVVEGFNAKVRAQAVLPDGRKVVRWDPVAPPTEAAPEDKLSGKTFSSAIEGSEPGWLAKNFDVHALAPEGPEGVTKAAAREADRTAQVGPTGLAPEDNAKVLAAIKASGKGSPEARDAALGRLVTWASSDRPDIAHGVLGLIQAENPNLYSAVLAKLPEELRTDRTETDAIRDAIGKQAGPLAFPPPPSRGR